MPSPMASIARRAISTFGASLGVMPGRINDTIEVLDFDALRIDQHQAAEAETRELLDHDAAGSGTPDNGGREAGQARPSCDARRQVSHVQPGVPRALGTGKAMPNRSTVIAGDSDGFERVQIRP